MANARGAFDRADGRVALAWGDVADYAEWALPSDLHAVVSALSIHHLADDAKRALFARIRSALRSGGAFVNAEQVLGATPDEEASNDARWLQHARAAGADAEMIAAAITRMREDRCAPLAAQLAWLLEAGFRDVQVPYENHRFAVYCGYR